ncbi:helix-turn-helix domain-containing protein [Schaalia sp. ZJ405]|uniref:helix-turn-helix domain-containing protein n=1 Tax=Schaalia sp. ZJ405 TaxID=2709403 RepID=UPI0013EA3760|nr:helix-turn-helix domain-containing protein [Schaalia sp. ZJ405]QPK80779.1 helix-turn-helix domain-containing protein [Schaalia sp. ZJ405]
MTSYSPPSERTHFLTLQEAVAEGYGAYSTLRRWITLGKLPAYKTGKRIKVLREDLNTLVQPIYADTRELHVEALVKDAPRLTDDQILRLRDALGGVR